MPLEGAPPHVAAVAACSPGGGAPPAAAPGPRAGGGAPPPAAAGEGGGYPPQWSRKAGEVPKKTLHAQEGSIIVQKNLNKHEGHTHEVIKR